jgi:hypothetical protein
MQLFTRHSRTLQTPNSVDDKGRPVWIHEGNCNRCGGAGRSDKWAHTGFTCYDCNGGGKGKLITDRLYTAEEIKKLDAAAAKRAATRVEKAVAKKAAADAEAAQRREVFEHDNAEILSWLRSKGDAFEFLASMAKQANDRAYLSPAQLAALQKIKAKEELQAKNRAASRYVGEVGERIEANVTVERVSSFTRTPFCGFGHEEVYVVTMRDEAGNCLVSMSPSFFAKQGDAFAIRATVKDHSTYRDEAQTKLQRIKIVEQVSA